MAVPVSDLQAVAPSAIIELFVLELNSLQHGAAITYRFHAGTNLNSTGDLVWAGSTYQRFPVEAEGFEYSGQGQLPRPKLRVSNILGTVTAILLGLPDGLEGAKLTRIRTLARYLDAVNFPGSVNPYGTPDPTAEFPREIYYVDRKSVETRELVEFELAAAFDLTGVRAPKRQCIANICQWVYRSAECSYTGGAYYDANDRPVASAAADVCAKRLSSCEARFELYTRAGTVTAGSNVLTVAGGTSAILTGEPVRGFGLPAGTTVAAVTNSTTLQLSATSNATSVVTVSGTPSTAAATMTVTSATGIAVGHQVAGPYMNGATVTGVSGTTVILSQAPFLIARDGNYVITGSFFYRTIFVDKKININTSGLSVGMRVFGPYSINATITEVNAGQGWIKLSSYGTLPLTFTFFQFNAGFVSATYYFMPASPSAATYTFSANQTYSFRDPNAVLPFGSFPGVGAYTA